MDQLEFFRKAIGILHASGLEYMVVGSFASGFWGEPRATYDVDVVAAIAEPDAARLSQWFPSEEFYFSSEAVHDAIRRRGQFKLIHPESGNKIDFMVQGESEWSHLQLKRRRALEVAPSFSAFLAAPEDVILGKLLFYKEGGSPKHLRDIAGILKMQGRHLDAGYVHDWAARLGVSEEWKHAHLTK
jgi:hypothetical protein